MRTVKLSIALPGLLCGIEGALWYWEIHSRPSVPSYLGNVSPAIPISNGLDFPASLVALLVTRFLSRWWGQSITGMPMRLGFLLCVAGCWFLIGRWLDHRAERKAQYTNGRRTSWMIVVLLSVLALGVFTLLASVHLHVYCFSDGVERALVQTWGVLLTGVPAWAIARAFRRRYRHEDPPGGSLPPPMPLTNARFFAISTALFATLLIYYSLIAARFGK